MVRWEGLDWLWTLLEWVESQSPHLQLQTSRLFPTLARTLQEILLQLQLFSQLTHDDRHLAHSQLEMSKSRKRITSIIERKQLIKSGGKIIILLLCNSITSTFWCTWPKNACMHMPSRFSYDTIKTQNKREVCSSRACQITSILSSLTNCLPLKALLIKMHAAYTLSLSPSNKHSSMLLLPLKCISSALLYLNREREREGGGNEI